jgi:hypothetical protein
VRDVAVGEDIIPSGDLVELNWSGEDVWPSGATVVPPFGAPWYTVHLSAVVCHMEADLCALRHR